MPRKSARQAIRNQAKATEVSWVSRLRKVTLRASVLVGLLLLSAATGRAGLYLLDLQVERLVVRGAVEHVAQSDLEKQLADSLNTGFLALDLDGIRRELEAMPWIYRATVRRRWPDAVVVSIEEQRPIARWGLDGFLNHQGDYFPGTFNDRWADLARLEGPSGSEAAMTRRYQNMEALLAPTGLQMVALQEDVLGQVTAELDNGSVLHLGDDHHIERLDRFVTLWRAQLADQSVLSVDMRYEHGAAVAFLPTSQWALGSTSAAKWKEIR